MATLEFAYTGYATTVTQDITITVLGEESDPLSATEEYFINVPIANFNKILQYSSNWTGFNEEGDEAGEQPFPDILFRPAEADSARERLQTLFNNLCTVGTGPALDRKIPGATGGTNNGGKYLFTYYLHNLQFNGSALDDADFPREAIRKIEEASPTGPSVQSYISTLDSTTDVTGTVGLLRGLFEQAVSAGKVSGDRSALVGEPNYTCINAAAGDKLSILVDYTFNKTRKYEIDGELDDTVNNDGLATSITIVTPGGSYTIDNTDNDNESATPQTMRFVITMVAE